MEAGAHLDHSVAPNPTLPGHTGSSGEGVAQPTAAGLQRTTAQSGADARATASSVSSAEYVVEGVKRHRKGVLLATAALVFVALAGAGALVWYKFYGRKPPEEVKRELKLTRLVTGVRGTVGGVSVSPDGELVYFIGGNTKTNTLGSLYQVPVIGGREPKKILDHVSGSVSLSPDGRAVAFMRNYHETGESALMTVRLDGGREPRKIASRPGTEGWLLTSSASWSPDGKRFALTRTAVTNEVVMIKGFR